MSRVEQSLGEGDASMSWVNQGEVSYIVERAESRRRAAEVVTELRARVALELPNERRAIEAAHLKATNRLSFAGAFAVATSTAHDATLLTGDPEILAAARKRGWRVDDVRSAVG